MGASCLGRIAPGREETPEGPGSSVPSALHIKERSGSLRHCTYQSGIYIHTSNPNHTSNFYREARPTCTYYCLLIKVTQVAGREISHMNR